MILSKFKLTLWQITNAAPKELLGTSHALGQIMGSLMRGIGPALGGTMYAWSMQSPLLDPFNRFFIFAVLSSLSLGTAAYAFATLPDDVFA